MAIEKYSGNRRALTHHPVMDDRLRYTIDRHWCASVGFLLGEHAVGEVEPGLRLGHG